MNTNPIGIFDSGVGGLTILSEIKKLLPDERFIYIADQSYMPYGERTNEEILSRAEKIASHLFSKKVKVLVVACNTATVVAIEKLREKFDLPIIGTVPVVKSISQATKTGKIAIFATPATSKSRYLQNLILQFAPDKTVIKVGESHLEDIIESGNINSTEIETILRRELLPLVKQNVDAIALGCTHYPFIKDKIQKIVGSNIQVFDSGGAIARRLKNILEHEGLLSTEKGEDLYYTTGDAKNFEQVVQKLLGKNIKAQSINLD